MTIGPDLDTFTLHRRLDQGIAGATSSRGSLTKCAAKYKDFLQKIFSDPRNDDGLAEAIEACKGDLMREIQLYMTDMRRVSAKISVVDRESQEMDKQFMQVQMEMDKERKALQDMQLQYPAAKQSRRQKEEYEALAKMANHRESRKVLEQKLEAVTQATLATEKSQKELLDQLSEKEKQFQLLMQVMLDLKAELNKKSVVDTNKQEEGEEEEEGAIPMEMDP